MVKMHADEVDIDIALVRRLLDVQCPQWSGLQIESVQPWGTDNAIFRLGEEMVVRMPRRTRTSETLAKELQWLPKLAPRLPVAIPVPLAEGTPALGYPFRWAVYTWLKGQTATAGHITDTRQLAVDLARFMDALWHIDPTEGPAPGAHNFFRGVPLDVRNEMTRAAIAALDGAMDVDAMTAVWEAAVRAPAWSRPPVWVHGDMDSRNILVEQGRLSGVIDFGGLAVGDPACDVMTAWKVLPPDARRTFRVALSIDDATWLRSRGWTLSQAVMILSYYTEETNPTLVLEGRRWVTELLVDSHGPRSPC